MKNNLGLIVISLVLFSCASNFKVGIRENQFYPLTSSNIVYIQKEVCTKKACFLSKCPIISELHSAFVSSLIEKGFEISDTPKGANYHIKITSVFNEKYVGQRPKNFYFMVLKKEKEKMTEVLKMAFSKEYNEAFLKNDLDFNKILNLSINTITHTSKNLYEF